MSGAGGRGVQHHDHVDDVAAARYPRAQPVRVHRHRTQPRRVLKEALRRGRRPRVCLCLNFSDLSGDHKHATTDAHLMAWVVGPRLITSSTTLPFTTTPAVPSRPQRHSPAGLQRRLHATTATASGAGHSAAPISVAGHVGRLCAVHGDPVRVVWVATTQRPTVCKVLAVSQSGRCVSAARRWSSARDERRLVLRRYIGAPWLLPLA